MMPHEKVMNASHLEGVIFLMIILEGILIANPVRIQTVEFKSTI